MIKQFNVLDVREHFAQKFDFCCYWHGTALGNLTRFCVTTNTHFLKIDDIGQKGETWLAELCDWNQLLREVRRSGEGSQETLRLVILGLGRARICHFFRVLVKVFYNVGRK